jgi:hypothetical protein
MLMIGRAIGWRRFEVDEKFWAIKLDGASHTVRFGKIGTTGQGEDEGLRRRRGRQEGLRQARPGEDQDGLRARRRVSRASGERFEGFA